jgi:hypothetical protein
MEETKWLKPSDSDWGHCFAHSPQPCRRVGLRIDLFEVCSAFTRVTACTLALSPYFVTRCAGVVATACTQGKRTQHGKP